MEKELSRAIAKIKSDISFSRDGPYSVASQINEALAIGDWRYYTTLFEKISTVTLENVHSVAKKYFIHDRSTIGYFIPLESKPEYENIPSSINNGKKSQN